MTTCRAVPTKVCAACGRTITWRKAGARAWDDVRYCSAACRRRRVRPVDRQLELAKLDLLDRRAGGSTICPSEAARAIGGDTWRELMEPARAAGRRLHAVGLVEVLQQGRVVDPSTARGPIRLRRSGLSDRRAPERTVRDRGRDRTGERGSIA